MKIMPIIGGAVVVLSLIAGIWKLDEHYATAQDLKKSEQRIYLRLDTAEYQALTDQYYRFKALVAQHPADADLKNQLADIEQQRKEAKARIDKALKSQE
jgi:uncharacterized protein (DUF58 family)